jgi:anti-anti-sigma factor
MNPKRSRKARAVDGTAEIVPLLEQVCLHILDQLGATSCALSRYDPDRELVSTLVTHARNPELEPPGHLEAGQDYALADYPATRHVLQDQVALSIRRDDPQADPAECAFLEKAGQQALLMLPLATEGKVIALLEIYQRDRSCTFAPDEISLAQALADQAALVIEGGHLFEGAWQEARDMSALIEAHTVIASSLDLETVLRGLAEQISRLLDVEECVFSRWEQEQGTVITWVKHLCGETTVWSPSSPAMVERLEDFPLTARVLQERVPAIVQLDDPQADPAERALLEELHMQSLLMLPVVAYDRVVGLVELREGRQRRDFRPREITLAQALANQAAIAIENARLFREREQRLAELAILNTIGQAISAPLDLDSLLKTVHEQVGRAFDATNFFIALYEEGSDEWVMGYQVEHGEYRPGERHTIDTGVTGYIIQTRQPVLLRTMAEANAWDEAHGVPLLGEQSRSWMGVPMRTADKTVGVMSIQSYEQEYLYGEQDLALFSTIATQVANALDNIRLLEETRRRAQEMEALNEVGQAITSVLDLDALLQQIVDITKTRFGYYFSCIGLVEGDHLFVRTGSTIGHSENYMPLERRADLDLREGPSLIAEAARTGQPVIVNDVSADPRYLAAPELPDTRAELDVPIIFQDRVVGVLDVQSARLGAFGQQEVALLQALVSQAGVAIENARLFDQRERQLTEMAILNEIGRTLASTLDLDQLARALREQAGRLFDTANFYVALYDAAREEWETVLDIIRGQPQPLARYSVQRGLTGHIIRQRVALLFHNAEELLRYMEEHGIPAIGETAQSWMGIPMIAADNVVGVMAVESYDTANAYSEADQTMLSTIAAQAATALQNARLYAQVQNQVEELRRANETQALLWQQVREMSIPVIPLQDRVLVLPLVGTIDSERARDLTERLLEAVRQTRALVILLDITGVPVVDTAVAQAIIQAANAARLLGAEVVLVGVRSEVAQTLVTLGVSMEGLVTKSNLQSGIAYALGLVGRRIVSVDL